MLLSLINKNSVYEVNVILTQNKPQNSLLLS